jgi:DNA polymerase-3 subunit beta
MKFQCQRDKFIHAFSKIEKVTSKGSSNPVLKSVLVEGRDSAIILKATNLDLGIEVTLPVKLEKAGTVAVSSSILGSFVQGLDKEKGITFEKEDDTLKVSTEHSSATLKLYSHEEFPLIPKIDSTPTFSINSSDFVKGLKSVVYSASLSSIKPELSSVFIYPEEDSLVFVATDSFRLAEKKIKIKDKANFEQILIPFKNVADIIRILEEENSEIDVTLDKNQISFSGKDFYLVSRVVDARFPAYKQIVPKESSTEVVILKQDLINALKVSRVFSDSFNRITLIISPKEKSFRISTKNTDVGENTTDMSASLKGEALQISFNYKNLIDCFQSVDADSVSLLFDGLSKPLIIKGIGDQSFFYLVMPMNK